MVMDDAEKFCRSLLATGVPKSLDYDDMVQEFCLAELEGRSGPAAIVALIAQHQGEQVGKVAINPEHHVAPTQDVSESDEEAEEHRIFEAEIIEAINADKAAPIYKILCDDVPWDRADVFKRYHGIQCEKESAEAIAKDYGWEHHHVNDVVKEVVRVIRGRLVGKLVYSPILDEMIVVFTERKRAWREIAKAVKVDEGRRLCG